MPAILTPDQRVRVFISSTLEELAAERLAAKRAIESLHLTPVLFELGARPHPPRELYRAYLEQSHVFVAVYWQRYGWVAPDMDISGLEDELALAGDRPKLVYLKQPAPARDPRLEQMLDRVREAGLSYRAFSTTEELEGLLAHDLSALLSERFQSSAPESLGDPRPDPLPAATSSFVGRESEVAEVVTRLRSAHGRLVTLVGPGGIGKTRLALEVGDRLSSELTDGVAYCPLESVQDPASVGQAILRALNIQDRGAGAPLDVLRAQLAGRQMLLVLDNFEHLLDGAGQVAELLAATTGLKVLATSREPLRLRGEQEVLVPSLTSKDAVSLFLDRARAGRPLDLDASELDAVEAICDRLDGVPLAIELAAARTRLLGPREILDRLGRRLDFLVSGPRDLPARQQALRSTIAWSHDLLDPEQQQVLAALGAFAGSFTERAAAAVTGIDEVLEVLASLVDKSLLLVDPPDGGLRLRMLGMVRDFAREQLVARGELDACRARHAEHYRVMALAEAGPLRTAEQTRALDRLDADAPNLRASLGWWFEHRRFEELAEVAWHLWVFAWLRGYLWEMRGFLDDVLAHPELSGAPRTRLQAAAGILDVYGGGPDGVVLLTEAVERARAEGADDVVAAASMQLAIAGGAGDLDEAVRLFTELGDDWGAAAALCAKAWVHVSLDAFDDADAVFDAALRAIDRVDDDLVVAMVLVNGAERSIHRGADAEAAGMVVDAAARYQRLRASYPASYALEAAARLASRRAQHRQAVRLLAAAEQMRASIDVPIWSPAQQRHDQLVESLRQQLPSDEFADAWRSVEDVDYQGSLELVFETLDLAPSVGAGSP